MSAPYEVFGSLGEAGCFRRGLQVYLPHPGGELPDRCVVCNAPTDGRTPHKLVFRSSDVTALMFLAPLIGLVLAATQSQRFRVPLGLCAEHTARRKRRIFAAISMAVGGLGMIVGGAAGGLEALIVTGVLLLLGAPFTARSARVVKLARVDPGGLVLDCGLAFVESLPPVPAYAPAYAPMPGYGPPMPAFPTQGPGWIVPPQQGFGGG